MGSVGGESADCGRWLEGVEERECVCVEREEGNEIRTKKKGEGKEEGEGGRDDVEGAAAGAGRAALEVGSVWYV